MPRYILKNGKSIFTEEAIPLDELDDFLAEFEDEEEPEEEVQAAPVTPDIPPNIPQQPIAPPVEEESKWKGLFDNPIWNTATTGLTDAPSRAAKAISPDMGFYGPATEWMGDMLSQATSPVDLLSLGAGSKIKALHQIGRAASGAMGLHGGSTILDEDTSWGEKGIGALEALGGILGMRSKMPKIASGVIDTPPLPDAPNIFARPQVGPDQNLPLFNENGVEISGREMPEPNFDELIARAEAGETINPADLAMANESTELAVRPKVLEPEVLGPDDTAARVDKGEMFLDWMDVNEKGEPWVANLNGKGFGGYADETSQFLIEDSARMQRETAIHNAKPEVKAEHDSWKARERRNRINEGKDPETGRWPENPTPHQLAVRESYEGIGKWQDARYTDESLTPEELAIYNEEYGAVQDAHAQLVEGAQGPLMEGPPPSLMNEGGDIFDQNTGEVIDMSIPPEQQMMGDDFANQVLPPDDVFTPPTTKVLPPGRVEAIQKETGLPKEIATVVAQAQPPPIRQKFQTNPDGTFSPKNDPSIKYNGAGKVVSQNGQPPALPPKPPRRSKSGKELPTDPVDPKIPTVDPKTGLWHEVFSIPRAIMASIDLPPFRQGLPAITNKAWWTSWDDMARAYGSQRGFDIVDQGIRTDPVYKQALDDGVKFTDTLSQSEESFSSKFASKVPLVARSHRAHIAYLNKLRMDSYKGLRRDIQNSTKLPGLLKGNELLDLDPTKNKVLGKQIAELVNDMTGRGSLGSIEKHADLLNNVLFSPRLMASRVRMYNRYFNPQQWMMMPPALRKETLKSLLGVAGTWSTVAGAAWALGAEVSMDMDSADFGKVKIGNFRMDPGGGFQQYLVAAHRMMSGEMTSTTSGKTQELGSQFGGSTRGNVAQRLVESKLNPPVAFIKDLLFASEQNPVSLLDSTVKMVTPIFLQSMYELYQEDPRLFPMLIPAMFGMGEQVYGGESPETIVPPEFDIEMTGGSMFGGSSNTGRQGKPRQ